MTKPICKSEARRFFWRSENPNDNTNKFSKLAKKLMNKARRRFLKINNEV